jgi:hypothetical protein
VQHGAHKSINVRRCADNDRGEPPIDTTAAAPPADAAPRDAAPDALPPARRDWRADALVLLAILIGAILRVWGADQGGDIADVSAYRDHVHLAVERGLNVYAVEGKRYPYFPGWLQVEGAVWQLALLTSTRFWWAIRLVIVAADVLACFAIWWSATCSGGTARGRWAAGIYALSPIAILISGHHGQFDALPTLFSVLAAGFMMGATPRPWASGLLLGLAVAMKPFPALLVPVFMRAPGLSMRARLMIGALAGAVVLLFTAPFLIADAPAVFRQVVGYPGLNDQGIGGLLRSLWLYRAKNIFLPGAFGLELIGTTRWLSLALIGLSVAVLWRHPAARVGAAVYLAFLSTFGGVSTQYLIWPLAWLLISDVPLRWAVVYSIGATAGAVGFYMVYWPQILLPGRWAVPATQNAGVFVAGQAIAMLTFWVTLGATLRAGRWQHPVVWVLAAIVLATLVPVGQQLVYLTGEWLKFRG